MKYLQGKYILDINGNPKPVFDVMEWTDWIEDSKNTNIALDWFREPTNLYISTEFTGTDRYPFGQGPPILFKTMVFDDDGSWEDLCKEYSTKEEALAGHAEIMKYLTGKS